MSWDFYFATDGFPARDRFEAWQEVSRRLVGVEATTDAPQSFDGEFAGCGLGPVTFVRSTSRMSRYERTRNLADQSDEVSVSFVGGNHRIVQPGGDDRRLASGGAAFLSHDRPFTLAQEDPEDTSFHFVIERRPLLELLPPGAPIGIRLSPANGGILSLVKGYIPTLTAAADCNTLTEEMRAMVGRHIVDLVAALLRPTDDAREAIEQRGLKAARIKAILDLVARHHASPDISAAWVGARLGISPRQVHRLVEETPKTLQEHILEARLRHAFDLLSDPFGPAMPISQIAAHCGFSQAAHFSRSFRTRFGDTPRGVRAMATRNAATGLAAAAA